MLFSARSFSALKEKLCSCNSVNQKQCVGGQGTAPSVQSRGVVADGTGGCYNDPTILLTGKLQKKDQNQARSI